MPSLECEPSHLIARVAAVKNVEDFKRVLQELLDETGCARFEEKFSLEAFGCKGDELVRDV